ncbi:dUTP diphosphatase [Corynebacterium accolens]|uniref:dUTP diphosphatase n=1 Tax=Corynebacterium accolens TaxID=38284 RepID=UPI00266F422C|nr:dUTP diphosphatase [Corynebacterium accolens]WKS54946.1 dUTP diphosphatase [Corynebacterium accolens]
MKMKVKVDELGFLPTRSHAGDAGLDLYTPRPIVLTEGGMVKVHLGISLELPPDTFGKIEGRSGLAMHGVDALGGVIDEGYRGEIAVVLKNHSDHRIIFNRGERIAQLIVLPYCNATPERADKLSGSERGGDGFGSTGH